jgi:hypothetical protein|eukprot:4733138-Prymnesium_polylepis.2
MAQMWRERTSAHFGRGRVVAGSQANCCISCAIGGRGRHEERPCSRHTHHAQVLRSRRSQQSRAQAARGRVGLRCSGSQRTSFCGNAREQNGARAVTQHTGRATFTCCAALISGSLTTQDARSEDRTPHDRRMTYPSTFLATVENVRVHHVSRLRAASWRPTSVRHENHVTHITPRDSAFADTLRPMCVRYDPFT